MLFTNKELVRIMKQYVAIKKGEAEPCVDSGQCAVK